MDIERLLIRSLAEWNADNRTLIGSELQLMLMSLLLMLPLLALYFSAVDREVSKAVTAMKSLGINTSAVDKKEEE